MKPMAIRLLVVAVLAVFLIGCEGGPLSTREKGFLWGGGIGAGSGAIIGAAVGHPAAGALIGGGTGLLAGGLIGDWMQGQEIRQAHYYHRRYRRRHRYEVVE